MLDGADGMNFVGHGFFGRDSDGYGDGRWRACQIELSAPDRRREERDAATAAGNAKWIRSRHRGPAGDRALNPNLTQVRGAGGAFGACLLSKVVRASIPEVGRTSRSARGVPAPLLR